MSSYSFLDVDAAIEGPGGSFQLGSGSGVATEGISVAPTGEKNIMQIGADGSVMHSLRADKSGTITLTLQKTSQTNAKLQNLFNYQSQSSQYWGRNTITIRNSATGDLITCSKVAFASSLELSYQEDGGTSSWTFHAGIIDPKLGTGTPEIDSDIK